MGKFKLKSSISILREALIEKNWLCQNPFEVIREDLVERGWWNSENLQTMNMIIELRKALLKRCLI